MATDCLPGEALNPARTQGSSPVQFQCQYSVSHFPLSSPSLYYRTLPSFLSYSFFLLLLISFSTRFCPGYISLSLRGNKTQGREEEGQREELGKEKDSLSSEDGRPDPLITAIIVQSGLLC